ncbi:MAG: DUF2723 domain-containing protein [Muribaculaceae bacterium]|nr:DUF2723 domain-containing protein [Muribaculaceae bacterium]
MKRYNLINNSLGWLCFVIAAVTYLLTIEPTASFWDCPEFISQGAKLEVGHPPGNPIFMLTARFFVTLFGCEMSRAAVAVNVMSALLSAGTILLLFWTITHLVRRLVAGRSEAFSLTKMMVIMGSGLCGALAYTWSDTFWFSAVEGEVYAYSSFCTALVFWLILKWENRADQPHSDRFLVLIAYVIGVSIAVHLLNLLCIPAIVLVFVYRKWPNANLMASILGLVVSVVITALVLYGLVPGFIKVAQGFELVAVNSMGMSFNTGALIYAVWMLALFTVAIWAVNKGKNAWLIKGLLMLVCLSSGLTLMTDSGWIWTLLTLGLAVYLAFFCRRVPVRVFNVIILSIFFIFVGYSSYALLLIRSSANPQMNQNAPDNVFTLASYLNREQYGQRPLLYGQVWAETPGVQGAPDYVQFDEYGMPKTRLLTTAEALQRDETGMVVMDESTTWGRAPKMSPDEPDRYAEYTNMTEYKYADDVCMLFPRMYSLDPKHVNGYKGWIGYKNEDMEALEATFPLTTEAGLNQRNTWAQQGYTDIYSMRPYFTHATDLSVGENFPPMTIWKPTYMDNMRFFHNYQMWHMYWRYFMWNFAGRQNDIQGNGEPNQGNWISGIPALDNALYGDQSLLPDKYGKGNKGHNVFYMLPLLMGLLGLLWQAFGANKEGDNAGIKQFWVVFFLFFMTGVAIVLYLNQTPGQPRERDYAFAGSFYAFAIWIGMGVAALYAILRWLYGKAKKDAARADCGWAHPVMAGVACLVGVLVPLQMVSQTWDDHDRSHRYAARDFGMNYLNSLDPDAIIFTYGDNDTFPLWYAQEVEGVRTDVRVINLSYLATDWYANQLKHPYYDAKPVPFLAQPKDYALEALGYSSVKHSDEPVIATEMLKNFYATLPANTETGYPEITVGYAYMPVDSASVAKAFGPQPDTVWRTMADVPMRALENGGVYLNRLLSYDIVANSIADGWTRPVYFATTVPNSYYLGLDGSMYSTGVAEQVTPFADAPVSPLADRAYENIMGKFRWGGLDDPKYGKGLYLDETIRRMVSTMRNAVIKAADEQMKRGSEAATAWAVEHAKANGQPVPATRLDMARALLNLLEEKMPVEAAAYDNNLSLTLASQYLQLYMATGNADDLARAQALLDNAQKEYGQTARYAASLSSSQYKMLGIEAQYDLNYLPLLIQLRLAAANAPALRAAAQEAGDTDTLILAINSGLYGGDTYGSICRRIYDAYNAQRTPGIDEAVNTGYLAYMMKLYGVDVPAQATAELANIGISEKDLVRFVL